MAGRLGAEVAARKEVEARLETAQQAADVAMQEKQEVAAELDQVREAFMGLRQEVAATTAELTRIKLMNSLPQAPPQVRAHTGRLSPPA
jgi:small-conductance mechanosensitive channel